VWLAGAALLAHPTASTHVTIDVGRAAIGVTIVTDGGPLERKLEALAENDTGRRFPLAIPDHVAFDVDGIRLALTVASVTRLPDSERVAIRLSAPMPPRAAEFTWRTSLIFGSYPLVMRRAGDDATDSDVVQWLNGPQTSRVMRVDDILPRIDGWALVVVGFTHIVPKGFDHILFVVGLFLIARRFREVLAQVTAFTIAHSVTLGLGVLGVVSVPSAIVEPLIALSIVYVAVENLYARSLSRSRLVVVFVFGLLHGLGFAEALGNLDLSPATMLRSLLAFNVGVEAGQLTVLAGAAAVVAACRLPHPCYERWIVRPASALIGVAGIFWAVERLI
jgi:hypothetical protein